MLRRRANARKQLLASGLVAVVLATGVLIAGALAGHGARAVAGGSGNCPKEILWCTVSGGNPGDPGDPGDPGGGDSGGGGTGCVYKGSAVACYIPGLGDYDNADNCYYREEDPQPPAGDPRWGTNTPADGSFYMVTCYDGPPPWGSGNIDPVERFVKAGQAGPSPLQLAEEALAEILLSPPDIGLAPSATGVGGLVGLPVWMWDNVDPAKRNTWGPLTNSKSYGALTVNITAEGNKIAWNMGDGHTVTCPNPGTKYSASAGGRASPTCGYRYETPSYGAKNGKFTVTATATWDVNWAGGGQSGVIVVTRVSRTTVRINEAQVVVK